MEYVSELEGDLPTCWTPTLLKALKFCDLKRSHSKQGTGASTEKLFQLQILATEKFQGIQGCENVFLIQMADLSREYNHYMYSYIYIYITLLVVVYIYSRIIVKDNWSVIWTQCIIHIHFCWPNSLSVSRGLPGHPRLWLSCSKSCMDRCCFQIKQNNNKTHQWMEGKTPERKMFVVPWNHFN